jgi:hypothetical protein
MMQELYNGKLTREVTRFDDGDSFTVLHHTAVVPENSRVFSGPLLIYRYANGVKVFGRPDFMDQLRDQPPMPWGSGTYEGDWRRVPHGRGTWTAQGFTYTGNWDTGRPHGHGTATWPDGFRYEGEWQNGAFHGNGKLFFPNGQRYEGGFAEGKPTAGSLITPQGERMSARGDIGPRERAERVDLEDTGRITIYDRDGRVLSDTRVKGMDVLR